MRTTTAILLTATAVLGCHPGNDRSDSSSAAGTRAATNDVALTGAGATFPNPLYSKWFADYAAKTGVKINYQSIGSGGGIRQLSEQTVDFGASDAPMTDEELSRARGGPVLHIPTVLGAVVLTYNLPELEAPLRLTGDVVADLFLGKITKWNDPRLAAINPGVTLPARDVFIVHRSDGSGTTFIFTDYLTTVNSAWGAGPGRGKEVQWPVGLGGKGNEGVVGQVKQTPGSIGYAELAYAKQNALPVARVRNVAGKFVAPTIDAISAAASALPAKTDYRVSIVNSTASTAYPIASFTWLLVYQHQSNAQKGRALTDFLRWALVEGEQSAASLDYAPLPAELVRRLDATINTITIAPAP